MSKMEASNVIEIDCLIVGLSLVIYSSLIFLVLRILLGAIKQTLGCDNSLIEVNCYDSEEFAN